jgi:hypothetical protein
MKKIVSSKKLQSGNASAKGKARVAQKMIEEEISRRLRRWGRKGGRATSKGATGKGTARRREITRRAAAARWRKEHPRAKIFSKKDFDYAQQQCILEEENNNQKQQQHAQKTIHRAS